MGTYDYSHLMTGTSQRLGSFWVHMVFDVDEIRKGAFMNDLLGIPITSYFKIGKLKGGTTIRDSYWRITKEAKGNADYNIGTASGGTQIVALAPGDTAAAWTQGAIDPNDSIVSYPIATEDNYIWLMVDSELVLTGSIELFLECVAGADDNY